MLTCTVFDLHSIQCFITHQYWYWHWVLALGQANIIGYWVLGALFGIVLTLMVGSVLVDFREKNSGFGFIYNTAKI